MWCKTRQSLSLPEEGKLLKVVAEAQWKELYHTRREVEKAYGLVDEVRLEMIIQDIRSKVEQLSGKWFLFTVNEEVVGEIGFVPFTLDEQRVARLQDVDILPKHQGKGFGQSLLTCLESYLAYKGY